MYKSYRMIDNIDIRMEMAIVACAEVVPKQNAGPRWRWLQRCLLRHHRPGHAKRPQPLFEVLSPPKPNIFKNLNENPIS